MKQILLSCIIELILIVASILLGNGAIFLLSNVVICGISLLLGGAFNGAFNKSNMDISNYINSDQAFNRVKASRKYLLFGIPSIVSLIGYYFFILIKNS